MTIYEYVQARAQAWRSMHSNAEESIMQSVTLPTETDLINIQKEVSKAYASTKSSVLLTKLINSLNYGSASVHDAAQANNPEYVEAFLKKIEDNIGRQAEQTVQDEVSALNITYKAAYQNLCNEWRIIIDTISEQQSSGQVIFALQKLEKKLEELKSQIESSAGVPLQGDLWQTFTGEITWIGNILKGFYLEAEGTKFLDQVMPGKIRAVQSGNIKVPFELGGRRSVVSMKEDIMLFSSGRNSIIIEYELDGKTYKKPLMDFLDEVQSANMTITLTPESYAALQAQSIAGVSAKSTKNNYFIFASNVTIPKLFAYAERAGLHDGRVWALQHLYKINQSKKKQLKSEHKDYTLLYNYIVSRIYPTFIGENNLFVLTREGLKPTYNFLEDNLNQGRYVRASENVRLSGKYKIQIERNF